MISVFGANGFVGSAYLKYSINESYGVPKSYTFTPFKGDLLYLISTTHNYHVYDNPLLDIETNLVWLMKCLKNTKPDQIFNFISSWFVYGDYSEYISKASEEDHCNPKGFYSITKRCAEQLVESYCITHKIPYRIFRLANVYGPGDHKASEKKNAMQWMLGKIVRGEDVELYNSGNTTRDYVHVRDVVRALDLCLFEAPRNTIINIGSGKAYKMKNIMNYAKKITGSQSGLISIDPPDFHAQVQVRNFQMNTGRLKRLGFKQEITLKSGIREICGLQSK